MNCLSSVSGGAVAYLRNLVPRLVKCFECSDMRHKLQFLAHEEQAPLFEGIEASRLRWVRGERPTGYRRVWWERRNLARILKEENIDIFFNPYQTGITTPGCRQVMMCRNMETFFFQSYRYDLKNWLRNHVLRLTSLHSLRRADRVIAISEFVRYHLTQKVGIDNDRIRMIYHGGLSLSGGNDDATDRQTIGRIGVENDFLLTPGALLPYRRCEDVIAAFSQCNAVLGSRMRLVIAGSGTDRRYGETIQRAIAASPVRDRIVTVGHVPWETMAALYRQCRVCILATEIEACPNIAIEAMAAGCVVVSSDKQPLPEMFAGVSLEYPARNIDQLAQKMNLCLSDMKLRQDMKLKATKRAVTFSWEKCAAETFSALTEWP